MKKAIFSMLALAAAAMTLSCEKEESIGFNTITGTGEIVHKSLDLDPFSRIELNGVANLYVTVGGEQSITLKAQQNIIEILTWQVSGSVLAIGTKEGISIHNHEEIRFEIELPAFTSLFHDGVGNVTLDGGNQAELDIDFRGIGYVHAYGLPVDHCLVLNSGTGDCKVKVNKTLEVDISALGNVYYRGDPQISSNDTGLGDLINDN